MAKSYMHPLPIFGQVPPSTHYHTIRVVPLQALKRCGRPQVLTDICPMVRIIARSGRARPDQRGWEIPQAPLMRGLRTQRHHAQRINPFTASAITDRRPQQPLPQPLHLPIPQRRHPQLPQLRLRLPHQPTHQPTHLQTRRKTQPPQPR